MGARSVESVEPGQDLHEFALVGDSLAQCHSGIWPDQPQPDPVQGLAAVPGGVEKLGDRFPPGRPRVGLGQLGGRNLHDVGHLQHTHGSAEMRARLDPRSRPLAIHDIDLAGLDPVQHVVA